MESAGHLAGANDQHLQVLKKLQPGGEERVRLPSLAETGLLSWTGKVRSGHFPTAAPPLPQSNVSSARAPVTYSFPPQQHRHWSYSSVDSDVGSLDALVAATSTAAAEKENTGTNQYFCTHQGCSKSFPSKSRLMRHMVIHSGVKPFQCLYPDCERAFSRRDNMLQHYRTHVCSTNTIRKMSKDSEGTQ